MSVLYIPYIICSVYSVYICNVYTVSRRFPWCSAEGWCSPSCAKTAAEIPTTTTSAGNQLSTTTDDHVTTINKPDTDLDLGMFVMLGQTGASAKRGSHTLWRVATFESLLLAVQHSLTDEGGRLCTLYCKTWTLRRFLLIHFLSRKFTWGPTILANRALRPQTILHPIPRIYFHRGKITFPCPFPLHFFILLSMPSLTFSLPLPFTLLSFPFLHCSGCGSSE